jgi:predicted oxidoreductase (fatty acid repression mutant protein)
VLEIIIKKLIEFAGSEIAKRLAVYSLKKVVDSTDNTIDNDVAEIILEEVSRSSGNSFTREV